MAYKEFCIYQVFYYRNFTGVVVKYPGVFRKNNEIFDTNFSSMNTLKTLTFEQQINAPRQKVWEVLWSNDGYREWTSVFSEGSYVETDWNEGSKILFLSGTGEGMYSEIARKIPNEFMSFRHIGMIKDGKEVPLDDAMRIWSGATENYTLKETNDGTNLIVEMQTTADTESYFFETFPKALLKVKEMAEA